MKCPICTDTSLTMSERAGIEIDYCPKCRGVWLDRGELDKIVQRSVEGMTPPRQSDHSRHSDDRYSHDRPYHGKKSIWQELFD